MNFLVSLFSPYYPKVLVYMLQNTEYQVGPYLEWWRRTKDFSTVMYRRQLVPTKAAKLLLLGLSGGMAAQALLGVFGIWFGYYYGGPVYTVVGVILLATYPLVWAYAVTVPLTLGRWFLVAPKHRKLIKVSEATFAKHPGVKIAVAGSYGKTSMKELLNTVLSEGKNVAATPANKNVSVSHAYFARKLTGTEDVLIIEYGEGAPGDVARFAKITHPSKGIITGLAPAHLDQYPSLQAAGEDIFSLTEAVGADNSYVNADSPAVKSFLKPGFHTYTSQEALGWKVSDIKVDFTGTKFTMTKGNRSLKLHSALLGRHQVGPLALVVALADELDLSEQQIKTGIGKTAPFEHRMQARALNGAWIIDDTYNGNIDGLKAGLELLKELPGKRKVYVTPGLVDQGVETEAVHVDLGKYIAQTKPDLVVLMQNSSTPFIQQGLKAGDYKGKVQIELKPLEYYTNLEHFLANGDVVMLQNDWTDNYN
jgi:UDP-N-acetylmuramoyl-tripeptide--D-alanyl-D-alanine ligase